ncbi:MAG: mechanosensitive ion channel family protein [Lachnospiraceae bacterium]|nr:mechanosensitive ion channel family protein [Lachnospiraceae bacterium]
MNFLVKTGIFFAVVLTLDYIVDLIYKFASREINSIHLRFVKRVVKLMITIVGLYSLAQQFEVTRDISKVLLQSGSLIIAIATFAAQQALSNVISGISISASRPYNVEEKIRVIQSGTVIAEGIVKDVTIRHTVISQFNGETCIVPNSVMDSSVIVNTNFTENVGNFIEVGISYDVDVDKAISILRKICAEHELTLNTEESAVRASGYTQNGVTLKVLVLTRNLNDSFQACSDIRIALIKEFKKNGINIPYHTVTVHMKKAEGLSDTFKSDK